MMRHILSKLLIGSWIAAAACRPDIEYEKNEIAIAIHRTLLHETLQKWYPAAYDTMYGGFLSDFTFDFKPEGRQDKMIVTQARHIWTNAKAAEEFSTEPLFAPTAKHGFEFLRDVMWDKKHGGFVTLVSRKGEVLDSFKTAYGNAFGIYALAAYYHMSKDTAALGLAKKAFYWLENHSHDPVAKGYFQHMMPDGTPVHRTAGTPSTAETGYKDQNSSIHLLEAFTELYGVWEDDLVRERLTEMFLLIRDKITTPKGYLTLFFQPDWTPVSFADSSEESIARHHSLDHVSFGHDIETAYLLLEASAAIRKGDDPETMVVVKRMADHALANGWDSAVGGFYDEGYYFRDKPGITITHDTKNWWAQAEGLNTLMIMADLYPDDANRYWEKFKLQWNYIDKYVIDHENGDWFAGGIDKQPDMKKAAKGHIWKACYHQYRALANCMRMRTR